MLHPTTQAIAESFGYVPFSDDECPEQFQADITFDPKGVVLGDTKTYPKNGSVYCDKHGKLQLYWIPAHDDEDLQGWYESRATKTLKSGRSTASASHQEMTK
jgi:hypothetical protein